MTRTFLSGADLVLPDRLASGGTLVVEAGRLVDILDRPARGGPHDTYVDLVGSLVVPGFIDGHVHGAGGHDVLGGPGEIAAVATLLPRWGVTAFCPTSVACPPERLDAFLAEIARLRAQPDEAAARVLPAHLESNFINPEYRGAQPLDCLRVPADPAPGTRTQDPVPGALAFSARDILAVIDRHRPDVGVVTLAPEIDGGLALVRALASAGVRVSLGHTGATHDLAHEAIAAGARRATHLFNRMSPMTARDPGVVGAVLASDEVTAELIGDGHHVHPAVMRVAIAAKGLARLMAITDGTAGSGMPAGSRVRLGDQPAVVGDVARLEDGTIAGSVTTMDRVFACLVARVGLDLARAAALCATSPARELGLHGYGVLAPGAAADLVVLSPTLDVRATWIAGRCVYASIT